MATKKIRRVAALRTSDDFRAHCNKLDIELPIDEEMLTGPTSPLGTRYELDDRVIGNRFAVLPMEGWDGETDGMPTELVRRRWRNFGASGAKLIWGGEAVAVRMDGRANPRQLVISPAHAGALAELRQDLVDVHQERFGRSDDLLIGLQLTHSGRFARPYDKHKLDPTIAYHHPLLDAKFGVKPDMATISDDEISRLVDDFVAAAVHVQQAGFDFIDIKHCHGYLGHELLTAVTREGRYGGSLENRTRFLSEVVAGIRANAPGLEIGVRLSAFDFIPFQPSDEATRTGEPVRYENGRYPFAFGGDGSGVGIDLTETVAFLDILQRLGIRMVCITAGSPYYNPHIQRPALFPPSDGYQPPEDPLVGVARQIGVVSALKAARPGMTYVGSGYSYLQEWLPHVAQHVVRTGMTDFVGLGRMILAYPDLPADIVGGRSLQRKRFCRTFSDCTTAPRNGMVSGCYPLDDFYKSRPEYEQLMALKKELSL